MMSLWGAIMGFSQRKHTRNQGQENSSQWDLWRICIQQLVGKGYAALRSVKDMVSTTCWKRLCCFVFIKAFCNHAKEYKKDEKPQEGLKLFLCSHLSTILDGNLEADLWLSCLSQMSMIVIFAQCRNTFPIEKRLSNTCSISVDDVPNGVSCPSSRFHEGDEMV